MALSVREFNNLKGKCNGETVDVVGYIDNCRDPGSEKVVDIVDEITDVGSSVLTLRISHRDVSGLGDSAGLLQRHSRLRFTVEVAGYGKDIRVMALAPAESA